MSCLNVCFKYLCNRFIALYSPYWYLHHNSRCTLYIYGRNKTIIKHKNKILNYISLIKVLLNYLCVSTKM